MQDVCEHPTDFAVLKYRTGPWLQKRHREADADENRINSDLETTGCAAAVIEDAVFILIVCLCRDGKALE